MTSRDEPHESELDGHENRGEPGGPLYPWRRGLALLGCPGAVVDFGHGARDRDPLLDRSARELGERGMLASDISSRLPRVLNPS